MPSGFVLLQCIGKAAAKNAIKQIPFGVGDFLIDAWDFWQNATREEQRAAQVEAVAQMSAAELRAEVARILREEAAALSAEQRAQIASYLGQVPAAICRSLRRPSDPSGTTLAVGTVFRKPEDLLRLLPAAMPRFKSGDRPAGIGDWELVELLGVGGFGEVWKARNPHMPEPVALKFCLDSKAAQWLRNEAALLGRIMSQGKHPGIVRLLHTYLSAGTPCLEYEYVEGGDLAGFILERKNGLSAEQAARWIKGLAEIVGFAHRLNPPIVHRDLKPANILLKSRPDGEMAPRITDFGIGALAIQEARAQLRRGSKSGEFPSSAVRGAYTPLYASPQQLHDDKPDPRDDVYALGVIWYQLLTGDLTKGRPGGEAWRKRLAERGMTPALLALLASSFEDERRDRPDNAVVLAEKLDRLLPSPVEDIPEVIPVVGPVPVPKPRPAPPPRPQKDGQQDYTEAVEVLRKAAEQGSAEAQNSLATIYANGVGVTKNDAEAVRWYRKAAEQGHADSQDSLGDMYEEGRGVAKNDAEAVRWYRKAAVQGDNHGQFHLGLMYYKGRGLPQDCAEAVEWFQKAADQGNPAAQTILHAAQLMLAIKYATGQGVQQDYEEAAKWYRKTAEQGNAAAQWNLGVLYFAGQGLPQDDAKAVWWYRKAAEQGYDAAQNSLGYMYEVGRGVAKNHTKAVEWYHKAAAQGDEDAKKAMKRLTPSFWRRLFGI